MLNPRFTSIVTSPLSYVIKQQTLINVFAHREDILMVETGRNFVNAIIHYHPCISDIVFCGLLTALLPCVEHQPSGEYCPL